MTTDRNPRAEAIEGLRALAAFLEANPTVPTFAGQRLNTPLLTNPAVEAFAAEHQLTVEYDEEGNASTDLKFGSIVYHVYGYVDFAEHCERNAERSARNWAARKGLELRPAEQVSA